MKLVTPFLLTFLLFSGFTSCMDDDDAVVNTPSCDGFGEGATLVLPDGSELLIVEIDDQVCPCDVVCFWAGQYVVTVENDGGDGSRDTLFLPANPLNDFDTLDIAGFLVRDYDPNLLNYCGGEIPEEELCFTIEF